MENSQEGNKNSSHIKKSTQSKFIYRIIILSDILFNLSFNRSYFLYSENVKIFSLL